MKVIIVGGGAAGLLAAYGSAMHGAETVVLEKNKRMGKKLLLTGKGRCNLTNTGDVEDFLARYPGNHKFLYSAFSHFFNEDIQALLHQEGVKTKTERGGRVFPVSDNAGDIVQALEKICRRLNTDIKKETEVKRLLLSGNSVTGVETVDGERLEGSVILATGGKSYPRTGSDGSGYKLAQQTGHLLVKPLPSLVPLKTEETWSHELAGLSLRNVRLYARPGEKNQFSRLGEMMFTHEGISGPVVLTMSRWIVRELDKGRKVKLSLDLKPALNEGKLDRRFIRDFDTFGKKDFQNYLPEILPRSLINPMVRFSGIEPERKCYSITRAERKNLVFLFKNLPLTVASHGGFSEAVVTQGGVELKQVDPATMESRLFANLYFAGEMLDIDGLTGGYNLQAAFSTGYLAGKSAALKECHKW